MLNQIEMTQFDWSQNQAQPVGESGKNLDRLSQERRGQPLPSSPDGRQVCICASIGDVHTPACGFSLRVLRTLPEFTSCMETEEQFH